VSRTPCTKDGGQNDLSQMLSRPSEDFTFGPSHFGILYSPLLRIYVDQRFSLKLQQSLDDALQGQLQNARSFRVPDLLPQ